MNNFAGGQLKNKKPIRELNKIEYEVLINKQIEKRYMIIDDATKPSIPSIKFIKFIIPTNKIIKRNEIMNNAMKFRFKKVENNGDIKYKIETVINWAMNLLKAAKPL